MLGFLHLRRCEQIKIEIALSVVVADQFGCPGNEQ
jgi:hypothetical protein